MKFQRFLPFPRSEGKNEKYTVILPLGARERMKILFVKGKCLLRCGYSYAVSHC